MRVVTTSPSRSGDPWREGWRCLGFFFGAGNKNRKVWKQVGVMFFPKQCGNTWGSYGSSKKPGWLDRGGGRGSVQNSSLFSWFRACMFVSSVNFCSFRGGHADARGFCL